MKRNRKLRLNRVMMLIVVLVFCLSFAVNAFGDVQETERYIDVTVSNGDSLWSLIKEYNPEYNGDMNKAIYEVSNLNQLENACLYKGQVIQMPIDL